MSRLQAPDIVIGITELAKTAISLGASDLTDSVTANPLADNQSQAPTDDSGVYEVLMPEKQITPVVFASPHSGRAYPKPFIDASKLDPTRLRRSEDAFVDELFAAAPHCGAPLLRALFPRAYVDPNREAFELDPAMFEDELPIGVNTDSPRIHAGLGTIARVVTNGEEIYKGKLRYQEAESRIQSYYTPYHTALKALIDSTQRRFGCCLLIDCHSMPSIGGPMDKDDGSQRVDMVLGDRFGASCDGFVTDYVDRVLTDMGFNVMRNDPYAGGFTTGHYSKPEKGIHVLQIEINRALYMNEDEITRTEGHGPLTEKITGLIKALTALDGDKLKPPQR